MEKHEGEYSYYDKNRRPICLGDVLKVFHFIGARNRKYYMYKVVTIHNDKYYATDIVEMVKNPTNPHKCLLDALGSEDNIEIIQGSGPGDFYSFEQRKRLSK